MGQSWSREARKRCREDSEELLQGSLLLSRSGLSDALQAKFSASAQGRALNCSGTAVTVAAADLRSVRGLPPLPNAPAAVRATLGARLATGVPSGVGAGPQEGAASQLQRRWQRSLPGNYGLMWN